MISELKDKRPLSIKEVNIAKAPDVYEAFLYRWTDITTGKVYVGVHKGYVGDGYWNSATDTELDRLIADKNSNIRYEVLEYGDYSDMTVAENNILTKDDAKNNPMYFNKTNGAPKYFSPDVLAMKELADKIKRKEFAVKKELISTIYTLPRLQVRFEEDANHRRDIKERIEDAGGNSDGCNPVVIYERRQNGVDIIGDGNHTLGGAYDAKRCTDVPVIRIPYEIHKNFTNQELIGVSNLMNAIEPVVKKPMNVDDGVKYVVGAYNNGTPADKEVNKEFLLACGFTRRKVSEIIRKAKIEIEKQNFSMSNQLWIDYTSTTHKKTLEATVENYRDKDTMCMALSSAMFKWDTIFNHMYSEPNTKVDTKTKKRTKAKSKIVIVVYHSTPLYVTKWKTEIQPDVWAKLDFYLTPLGYEFTIHEMPTTIQNGLI